MTAERRKAQGEGLSSVEERGSARLAIGRRNVPRIGAKKSLTLSACERVVREPFENVVVACLDLLFADRRRPGVSSEKHARVLFRRWLELSITHDRETGGALEPYFSALLPFYTNPADLRSVERAEGSLTRKQADEAIRKPFEGLLDRYLKHVYNPSAKPGIRDEFHARETFVTYCGLLSTIESRRGRD
jgi:hypothetical protein